MRSVREINTLWARLEWNETDEPQTVFTPHCHDKYEIYCFVSGEAQFRVEGELYPLEPGSVLLLDRQRFHSVQAMAQEGQPYSRLILHLSPELFHPDETVLLELFRRPEILYPGAWQQGIQRRAQTMERAATLPDAVQDLAIRTETIALLVELFAMSDTAVGPTPEQGPVRDVLAYINANLTEPLTLESLAARFYLSRNTLARAFKKATGSTLPDYILYKRIALAQILLQAGHPIGVVARECGYSDYSTFYRAYRKVYGHSPSTPGPAAPETAPVALAPDPQAL